MTDKRSIARVPLVTPSPLTRYRSGPEGARVAYDDVVLVSEQGAGYALVIGPVSPERFFGMAGRFFSGSESAVTVESDVAPLFEEYLDREGWSMVEEEPAMVLTPIPEPGQRDPGIAIEPVGSEAAFDDFMRIAPETIGVVPSLDTALDPDVALLVGYLDGEPVATARLTCFGEVGELTGIVTAEDHRRRGFGTAMTWAAIVEGIRRGCTAMTLTSTSMGYNVYCRMGFVPVCSYRTYLPPGARTGDDEG